MAQSQRIRDKYLEVSRYANRKDELIRAEVAPEPLEVACPVHVSAEAAKRAVAIWLISHVHMVIYANLPRL